jgi:hypothetical protein
MADSLSGFRSGFASGDVVDAGAGDAVAVGAGDAAEGVP